MNEQVGDVRWHSESVIGSEISVFVCEEESNNTAC